MPNEIRVSVNIDLAAAYANWLNRVPWQLFCTLTFAHPVSDQQGNRVFLEFINRVERRIRAPITYVRGDEKRFSGCGMPASPRHYHLVLASVVLLDRDWLRSCWESMAGERRSGAGGDFRPYDPKLAGIAYVLKKLQYDGGDWQFNNLDYFFLPRCNTVRFRRRIRRHLERLQLSSSEAPVSGQFSDSCFERRG